MTTPTGDGNGIDIPITTHVDGDPAQQVRQLAEDAQRALREGVTGAPVELPGFDATALYSEIDNALERLQARFQSAARNMGLSLAEGVSGGAGLMGSELRTAVAEYQRVMEATVGSSTSSTWTGTFDTALRRTLALIEQLGTAMTNVDARGRAIQWPLTEEARTFLETGMGGGRWSTSGATSFPGGIQHGSVVPAPPSAVRPVAGQMGDLERVRAEGMAAISRLVVDDATYAFENGEFFRVNAAGSVMRARGAVDNPELLDKLQTAVRANIANAEGQIVREHLDRLAAADPGVSRYGMIPSQVYGPNEIPGHEIIPSIHEAIASNDPEEIRQAAEAWQMLGVTAREAPQAIGALNEALGLLDLRLQQVRQAALEAEYAPLVAQTQRAMLTPPPIGTATEEEENALLAQIRARAQAAQTALNDQLGQSLIRSAENRMYPELVAGGAGRPPTTPPPATGVPFHPDDENEAASADFYRRAMQQRALTTGEATRALIEDTSAVLANARALSEAAGITEEMVDAQRRLASIPALTPEMTTTPGRLGADTELAYPAMRGARTSIGPNIGLRTETGDVALFNPVSKTYQETISQTEALERIQAQTAASTDAAARAATNDARSWEELSNAELRAFIALQEYNQARAEAAAMQSMGTPYQRAEATLSLRDAQSRYVAASREQTQGPQGFLGQFYSGLTMARGADEGGNNAFLRLRSESGEFLGAIARYQAAYAVIFTVTRGFGALMQAEEAAQDQAIEFGDATGTAGDQADRFAASLGGIAAAAGMGVAEAMSVATQGIYAFGDQLDRTREGELTPKGKQQARDVGTASVTAASMGKVLTGAQDIGAVEAEIIAATRGFNMGFQEQTRVLDAAANASRNYGGSVDQILQGLPQVAEVAHQAGLSIEATANIMSIAITRSGQTGTAAANAIDRSLLAIDQPGTRQTLAGMGVDVSGASGQVLESLAAKWHGLSAAQQDAAEKALGGVRAVKTLLPVLQEGQGLLEANKRSYDNAGFATELYYKRLNTLTGVIRQFGGDFKVLANDIARTGALDLFGGALKALHPFLEGLDDIAKLIDLIPSSLRGWIVNLVAVSALLAIIGRQQATVNAETAVAGGGGGLRGLFNRGAATAETTAATTATNLGPMFARPAALAEEEGGALSRGVGNFTNGLRMAGSALIGPVGLTVGIMGATAAVGGLIEATNRETAARKQAAAAETQFRGARSADDLRAAATALGNAAVEQRHANGGIFGGFVAGPTDVMRAEDLQRQSRYAAQMADAIENEQQHLSHAGQTVAEFFQHSSNAAQTLATGLDAMATAGVPAVRQIRLLDEAIRGLIGGTADAPHRIRGAYATEATVAGLVGAATDVLGGQRLSASDLSSAGQSAFEDAMLRPHHAWYDPRRYLPGEDTNPNTALLSVHDRTLQGQYANQQLQGMDPAGIRDAIQRVLKQQDLGTTDLIDPKVQQAIATAVVDHVFPKGGVFSDQARARIGALIRDSLRRQFEGDVTGSPVAQMSTDEFHQFVAGVNASGQSSGKGLTDRLQAWASTDDPRAIDPALSRLRGQRQLLQDIVTAARARGDDSGDIAAVQLLLNQTEHDLAQADIARIDRLRKAAEAGVSDPTKLAALELQYVRREVMSAAKQGDLGALSAVLGTASRATINSVKHSIQTELDAAKLSYESSLATYEAAMAEWASVPKIIRETDPGFAMPKLPDIPAKLKQLRAAIRMIDEALSAGVTPTDSAGSTTDPNAIAEARIQAQARPGNAVSEARASLAVAQYARDHAKNQEEYWNAVKQVEDAEYQLSQAMVQHAHEARLTHIDQTDPLAMAREDVRTARETLRHDQAGGTGDISADEAAVQAARARAQAAAFSQRLSDVQTAHDLGRMSDAAYLRWLEDQSKRLHDIHGKTRQQIDEMNQIDEALKAAADQMTGQWNLGNIKIPTPYEARRYIQTQAAGQSYQNTSNQQTINTTQHVTINVKSAPEFDDVLTRHFGPATVSRAPTTHRRG